MTTVTYTGRQTIRTRYLGATNYRPSRVKAVCQARSIVLSYDHGLDMSGNHEKACATLLDVMKWSGRYVGGYNGHDCVFVAVDQ